MKFTMSLDDALGLLRKWKSEPTPLRVVAVVVGDIVTVNFRGCISEVTASRLILAQDPTTYRFRNEDSNRFRPGYAMESA
jgi:hypothetical protein